jgi:hypothetical protein
MPKQAAGSSLKTASQASFRTVQSALRVFVCAHKKIQLRFEKLQLAFGDRKFIGGLQ